MNAFFNFVKKIQLSKKSKTASFVCDEKDLQMSTTYGIILIHERFVELHFAAAVEMIKLLDHQPAIFQRAFLKS